MKLILLIGFLSLATSSLWAEYFSPIVKNDKVKLELRIDAILALYQVYNAQWGAGSIEFQDPNVVNFNPYCQEGYVEPHLAATFYLKNTSEVYGKVSGIFANSSGQGDASPASQTSNNPAFFEPEETFVGWRSGKLFKGYEENLIDFSIGNQRVLIADGFLIAKGAYDGFRRAQFFLANTTAFRETAFLRINSYPMRGQLYHLRTNCNQRYLLGLDQPKAILCGANVEYSSRDPKNKAQEFWTIGFNYFHIYRGDKMFTGTTWQQHQDGLHVYNPHMGGFFFPWNRDLRFYAGYVYERNTRPRRRVKASAYFIEPGYVFSKLWASPVVYYRYSFFSGDSNPGSSVKKSYDPLMLGYWLKDGYGTWEVGEIWEQFYYSNSNQKVHCIHVKLTPTPQYAMGGLYYIINFDKPQQAGSISKRGSTELDLYFTWTPSSWVSISTILAANWPKTGAIQAAKAAASLKVNPSRIGKTVYLASIVATFNF